MALLVACTTTPPVASPTRIAVATARATESAPTATPGATALPAPTVFVPRSAALEAGLLYYCEAYPFPIEVLEGPANALTRDDPAAAVLTSPTLGMTAVKRWWMVYRSETDAEFLGRTESRGFPWVRTAFRDGAWIPWAYGRCRLDAATGALDPVGWWIPADQWPSPSATVLHVRARGYCPGTLADRLALPTIRYGTAAILVLLSARPTAALIDECGRNQVASLTIHLDEAVGDRALLDGTVWPNRDARVAPPALNFSGG
jgi:hypothetical protein